MLATIVRKCYDKKYVTHVPEICEGTSFNFRPYY